MLLDPTDDPDRGHGGLSPRDRLEIERFANEAYAELRAGAPWRDAWSSASRPIPDDFGDEEEPWIARRGIWVEDALRAIFTGGPAPVDREPDPQADVAPPPPRERRRGNSSRAYAPPPVRLVSVIPREPPKDPPRMPGHPRMDFDPAVEFLTKHGPAPVRTVADALKIDAVAALLMLRRARTAGAAVTRGHAMGARWEATPGGAPQPRHPARVEARATKKLAPRAAARAAREKPPSLEKVVEPSILHGAVLIPAPPEVACDDLIESLLVKRKELVERVFAKVRAIDNMIRAYVA